MKKLLSLFALTTVTMLISCGGGSSNSLTSGVLPPMIDSYGVRMADSFGGADGGAAGADGAAGDGAAIPNSTVVLTDSKGKTVSATTDASGRYHALVTGFVPPIIGYVVKPNGSRWYAPSLSTPVARGFITINLTGLTDKIASDIATANGKSSSAQLTAGSITSTSVSTAIASLNNLISAQIVAAGLNPATFNPITLPLVTNGKGYDQILDNLAISNTSSTPTVIGAKFGVGGTISGLGNATGLTLKNGNETLTIPTGANSFQFAIPVAPGANYNVTIGSQPSNVRCSVTNGTGIMGNAAINSLAVLCNANTVALGGSITGLSTNGLVLLNAGQTLSVPAGASSFTFPSQVPQGGTYAVTIQTQPDGGSCNVSNGSGTAGASPLTNVVISCSVGKFTVGGVVNGVNTASNTQLILSNGGETLPWGPMIGSGFTFNTPVAAGQPYNVVVAQQQAGYTCTVVNGSGTMGATAVTNVVVNCTALLNALGGSITGLSASGLVLGVGTQGLTIPANASSFTFATGLPIGTSYNVTVQTQPTGQTCSVSNGSGTMDAAAVNNVAVTCSSNSYTLGGTVTGLNSRTSSCPWSLSTNGQTRSLNNILFSPIQICSPSATSSYDFSFLNALPSGTTYNVTISSQPAGFTCTVNNGAGTVISSDITNVSVNCVPNQYTLGGTVTGLTASTTLAAGSQTVNIAANATSFTFPSSFSTGSNYNVTVQTQPTGQTCTVSNGSGTFSAASINSVALNCVVTQATVSTLAGSGSTGFVNGTGTAASFALSNSSGAWPMGNIVAVNASGTVYVADVMNNVIRQITSSGQVSTLAGSGIAAFNDGIGSSASFNAPSGLALDGSGNLYVADQFNNRVRLVTPTGSVTTVAGDGTQGFLDVQAPTPASSARFNRPTGVTLDSSGKVFVADLGNRRIRVITPPQSTSGVSTPTFAVSTLAGSGISGTTNGIGTSASFQSPQGLTVDASGNLLVTEGGGGNNLIRKITPAGVVSTFAGTGVASSVDGPIASASFNGPQGIAVSPTGVVYVTEVAGNKIRTISPSGIVSTYSGSGAPGKANGPALDATYSGPSSIALDAKGVAFIADVWNNLIRRLTP